MEVMYIFRECKKKNIIIIYYLHAKILCFFFVCVETKCIYVCVCLCVYVCLYVRGSLQKRREEI